MRVLVTGAGGFLGGYITAALRRAGHEVVAAVRDPARFSRQWPGFEAVRCDLRRDVTPEDWRPRLSGIDALVNCAGLLEASRADHDAVHVRAPAALFEACAEAGIRTVIQISALGAGQEAGTVYAASKHRADEHLRALDLDWVVLRPSVVYAPGAYGGTALFRGLAALPGFVPLVGDGRQQLSLVHIDDLCATVLRCLESDGPRRQILDVVGPEPVAVRDMLARLRAWLGLPPARFVALPVGLCRAAARLGGVLRAGPLSPTAMAMLERGNSADPAPLTAATGLRPRGFAEGLAQSPAQTGDLWQARLYFVRPLLLVALIALWLLSGVAGLMPGAIEAWAPALGTLGLGPGWAAGLLYAACAFDLAIAALLALRVRLAATLLMSLAAMVGYTLAVSVVAPGLWLDPLGPVAKNLPAMAATVALLAMARTR